MKPIKEETLLKEVDSLIHEIKKDCFVSVSLSGRVANGVSSKLREIKRRKSKI